jgi:hypothetical protein
MYESIDKSKRNKTWIIILSSILLISIGVIYWQNQSINEDEKGIAELKESLKNLTKEIKSIKLKKHIVEVKKDSLQRNLDYLWQYKPLVQATKFRDQIGENFNFHPGDRVRLKSDSTIVVLTDILVGGNRYNYFIKFIGKNNKGNIVELSPIEIEKFKQ